MQLLLPHFHKGIIYQIINIQNNKSYIGQTGTENPEEYIKSHFDAARRNADNHKKYLYNAIRKYGVQNFKWRVLGEIFECDKKELKQKLNEAETLCIYHFRTFGSDGENFDIIYGYNMTKYGDAPMKGKHHTKETKNKISKNNGKGMLGKKHKKSTCKKISLSVIKNAKNNPNYGSRNKPFTKEHCENISKSLIGHKDSEKTKIKKQRAKKNHTPTNCRIDLNNKINEIEKLHYNGISIYELSLIFNCSRTAIRNRLKN